MNTFRIIFLAIETPLLIVLIVFMCLIMWGKKK